MKTVFGREVVQKFFEQTHCHYLIRAHQPPELGIKVQHSAQVLTVFSSSHYCGGNNRAAIVLISDGKLHLLVANTRDNILESEIESEFESN